ncbi:MAG: asparagine--tRNA ligase [bacterium]|nr:asparagine--tRNA ligase [bacterium]
MNGPYTAIRKDGRNIINYLGSTVFEAFEDVQKTSFSNQMLDERLEKTITDERFHHLHVIDSALFFASTQYFKGLNADWCNLPLTTLMISSPGEMYAGKNIDYTTDALPVTLSWFDQPRDVFLSESSQFYLELRLMIDKVDKVFSIYNSFRKEKADFSHLSEFQHIEFEGKVSFEENIKISIGLMDCIVQYLLKNTLDSLSYFLTQDEIAVLRSTFDITNFERLTFKQALKVLREDTNDARYDTFSLINFGAWEEIRLTEITKKHLILTEFPLLQIPFYHNELKHDEQGIPLAENADIILYGYRETIGSGVRISNLDALKEKAKVFNLPIVDYAPYLKTREYAQYQKTAGFGMGWQRFTHWLLKMPAIWESTHVPRGHLLPIP